jgi:uncharacterized membrane protein
MNLKIITLLIVAISLFQIISSQSYYADLEIEVDKEGFVDISGLTNYGELLVKDSESFVSKENGFWKLEIATEEFFSEYVYQVKLPKYASINYIKSKGNFRIETSGDELTIIGFAENAPLEIIIQYSVLKKNDFDWKLFLFLAGFILLIFYIEFRFRRKSIFSYLLNSMMNKPEVKKEPRILAEKRYDLRKLTDRQKKIMKFLIARKTPVTQIKICKELGIPKASVSRNIVSLEMKGFILKENIGVSTIIRLKN